MTPAIQSLHKLYCDLTGFKLSMKYDRERYWYEFIKAGFTAEDLRMVVGYLKREIEYNSKRGIQQRWRLKFSVLIESLDRFEEERELAKNHALRSRPEPSNKDKVIQVFRPTIKENLTVAQEKSAGEVAKKLIEDLRKAAE